MVVEREPDCWTRVLRRSAGWRRKAVVQPEPRPARKWKAVVRRSVSLMFVGSLVYGIAVGARAVLCDIQLHQQNVRK
jgi:hypothetical protein